MQAVCMSICYRKHLEHRLLLFLRMSLCDSSYHHQYCPLAVLGRAGQIRTPKLASQTPLLPWNLSHFIKDRRSQLNFIWRLRWSEYCNTSVHARMTKQKPHKLQARSRLGNICHLPTRPEIMLLFRGKATQGAWSWNRWYQRSHKGSLKSCSATAKFTMDKKGGLLTISHASTLEPNLLLWTLPLHGGVLQVYTLSFCPLPARP